MLLIRTYDHNYILPIYAHYKLGQLFDIFINDQKIEVVSEDESLLNYKNGTVHFVLIESKTKKRKLPNTGFWKQNGVESIVDVSLPESYQGSKRTFTYQDDKKFKCWEYVLLLFFSHYGYNVLMRHYLKDNSSSVTRYTSGNIKISIRANDRNPFFSKNDFLIDHNDYEIIDSIFNFVNINKFNIQDINKYIHNNNNNGTTISPTTLSNNLTLINNNNNNNNNDIKNNNNNNNQNNLIKNNFIQINNNKNNLNNNSSTNINRKIITYTDENEKSSSEDEDTDGANLLKSCGSSKSSCGDSIRVNIKTGVGEIQDKLNGYLSDFSSIGSSSSNILISSNNFDQIDNHKRIKL